MYRSSPQSATARTGALGFQGGLSVEVALGAGLAVLIQADGRVARISALKGDLADSTSWFLGDSARPTAAASFWAYETTSGGKTYPLGSFSAAAPSDAGLRNIREAGLDLSAFGISAGLRFGF